MIFELNLWPENWQRYRPNSKLDILFLTPFTYLVHFYIKNPHSSILDFFIRWIVIKKSLFNPIHGEIHKTLTLSDDEVHPMLKMDWISLHFWIYWTLYLDCAFYQAFHFIKENGSYHTSYIQPLQPLKILWLIMIWTILL